MVIVKQVGKVLCPDSMHHRVATRAQVPVHALCRYTVRARFLDGSKNAGHEHRSVTERVSPDVVTNHMLLIL